MPSISSRWRRERGGRLLFDAARQSRRACAINGMYLRVLADNLAVGISRHRGGRAVARKTIDIGGKPRVEMLMDGRIEKGA